MAHAYNWKLETGFTVYNFIFAEQKLHPSINVNTGKFTKSFIIKKKQQQQLVWGQRELARRLLVTWSFLLSSR